VKVSSHEDKNDKIEATTRITLLINLLKPTGYVMHQHV
jgi:hypothetical protein